MSSGEAIRRNAEQQARMQSTAALRAIAEIRRGLPIYKHRDEILAALNSHQVMLVAGETGCGKTTQVPQVTLSGVGPCSCSVQPW